MAEHRCDILTGALITLCLVLAVVSVVSENSVFGEAEFENFFKQLLRSVDRAFSNKVLDCPSYEGEYVKTCMLRAKADSPNPFACSFQYRLKKCLVRGYSECENVFFALALISNLEEHYTKESGCAGYTPDPNLSSQATVAKFIARRKREDNAESKSFYTFKVVNVVINQLETTFN